MSRYTALFLLLLLPLVTLAEAPDGVLLQSAFDDGADGWTAIDKAAVAPISRRPDSKSLVIHQHADADQDSAWLSPVMANPGQPVVVSVWAADNYLNQKDHSFSAAFELVPCEADGTVIGNGGNWTHIPWEDERQIPQFRHTYTEAGLQWQHYRSVQRLMQSHFRVRLTWPKSRIQGSCYFDDIQVRVATQGEIAAATETPATAAAQGRFDLDLSTSVVGNLFYPDEPFRWEFLLYSTDGEPLGDLGALTLRYAVTDYEYVEVASGSLAFAGEPRKLPGAIRDRQHNLHQSALLPTGPATAVGRHFFLRAEVLRGETVIASDVVTYGVVDPRQFSDEELPKSRHISFYEGDTFHNTESPREHQALIDRTGMALSHDWDYHGWRKAQPSREAPITIEPSPTHPKLVYCPNLEQIRGRKPNHPWGDMTKMAPSWAVIDDPLRPGCKTFEIDAYVDYIVAYVRANRARIVQVVPSGLERDIDSRTLELQRKVYARLKAEFPDLPVGMMVWEVLSAKGVDLIMEEKLYEVADFFDTHVYLSAVDWTEAERLRRLLKKKGLERPLISTEFARVGGGDQLQRSRDIISSQLDAHAHGMYRLTYFNMYVGNNAPIAETILRGEYPGDGFQWMQYVDRPRIAETIDDNNWRKGLYGKDYRGSSLMPMLHCMAFYNMVQATECADFKLVFQPTDRSIAYVYERDGKTRMYVYLREPAAPALLSLQTTVPYTSQDLFGRTDAITPLAGQSLLVASLNPLLLTFDGVVSDLYAAKTAADALRPVAGGVTLGSIARGAGATLQATLPAPFDSGLTVEAVGPWQTAAPATVTDGGAMIAVTTAAGTTPGEYTATLRLRHGDTVVSVLKQPVQISELINVSMAGDPMTVARDPAVVVTIRSLGDQPMTGEVQLRNAFFGTGFEPAELRQRYEVGPRGTAQVRFPIPREQVSLALSYVMRATVIDDSGFRVSSDDDISFQASQRAQQPITIDGDLSDWQLDEMLPIPFSHWYRGPRPATEFDGRFYSRWDAEHLYFAAVVTDNVPVVNGVDQVEWNDDNIMFCLYPWRWHMGTPLNTGYYREHLGPITNGAGSFMRAGYVPSGPSTAEGAQIHVRRTDTGWVYEWAYPKASLYPLDLSVGGGFRLSLSLWDQHQVEKKGWGQFSWLTFAGHNTSVNARPALWPQFTFID